MKLYPKTLHSLEELKREKHVLRYAAKHTDDLLRLKDLTGTDRPAVNAGLVGSLISALGSKSLLSTAMALAPTVLTLLSKRKQRSDIAKSNPLEKLAKEIIGGYLKWKAVQFVFRSVKRMVSSDKEKLKKHGS